jgi:glycosyltransferase involved in cell wall biosynthesis
MKILYHHRIASKDGQFVHVDEIIRALINQGHEVLLVGPPVHENTEFGHDGGLASKLKSLLPKFMYETMELLYGFVVAQRLNEAIKSFQPDVIYERYNLYQPVGAMLAKHHNIPFLLEVNAPLKLERERFYGKLGLPRLASWTEKYTWNSADMVFPVSDVLADYVRDAGVNEENITVLHNGVRYDTLVSMFSRKTKFSDKITIGFSGFMHLTCGVEWAIEAIAELDDPRLHLECVGDGDVLQSLKDKAQSLGVLDKVTFHGLVDRDKIFDYVQNFDIAIQPDVTDYASPLKMFEYMAVKSLIIAPRKPNIEEILTDECAVFFEAGNPDAFKRVLVDTLKDIDSHRRKRNAVYGHILDKKFTWDNNANRISEISKELTKKTTELSK